MAARFRLVEEAFRLVALSKQLLDAHRKAEELAVLHGLVGECVTTLWHIQTVTEADHTRRCEELDELLHRASTLLLQGRDLRDMDFGRTPHGVPHLIYLLQLAAGWYLVGWSHFAESVVEKAWSLLTGSSISIRDKVRLASAYTVALGCAPGDVARRGLEAVPRHLNGVRDAMTTARFFSATHLELIESLVLSGVAAVNRENH